MNNLNFITSITLTLILSQQVLYAEQLPEYPSLKHLKSGSSCVGYVKSLNNFLAHSSWGDNEFDKIMSQAWLNDFAEMIGFSKIDEKCNDNVCSVTFGATESTSP